MILDLGLPDLDGAAVLQQLREWFTRPIHILSVRDDEASIVKALDEGADDYLTKPFKLGELIARMRVAQRHVGEVPVEPIVKFGDLQCDFSLRRVFRGQEEIRLTPTEYDLLRLFIKHSGRILTHAFILKAIWGPNSSEHRQYLRVYVGHLRHKIEADPNRPVLLITEPGVGYRFGT